MKTLALQLVIQLPHEREEALCVLALTHGLLEFLQPASAGAPLRVVRGPGRRQAR